MRVGVGLRRLHRLSGLGFAHDLKLEGCGRLHLEPGGQCF